ncbi:MAG TPA: hypothetical protein VKQ30_20650 [Ktedonobacterales bacterium]|nr:hypothetical protein [Ktedonobacterales bacterium]
MKKFTVRVEEVVVHEFDIEAEDNTAAYVKARQVLAGDGDELLEMHEVDSKGLEISTIFEAAPE